MGLMDLMVWGAAAAFGAVLIALGVYFLPARTTIVVDTPTSTARAEMRLLWGLGPRVISRALPAQEHATPLAVFNDAVRISYALMTPGIIDAAGLAIRSLNDLNPRTVRVALGINLGDTAQNLVVQTAAQAALALAPASLRERVAILKTDTPGASVSADIELDASPAQLAAIYGRFKNARAAQEFRRRLKRKIKPNKKPAREVRVS
jgi:hypothetical protein